MKKSKVVIPALGLIALSTAASITGTVAWFSANNSVTVGGMVVKTKVSTNLLIDSYSAGSWATNDSTFASSLTQTINSDNVLVPMSTINGKNFWYTDPSNVKGDGDAKNEQYIAYTDLATLQEKYPDAEAPYLDYHFVLKGENTAASARYINLTKCDLVYSGARDSNKAFRVAVFADEFATAVVNGAKTAPGLTAAAKTILSPGIESDYFTSGKAVNSATTLDSVATLNSAANLATVAASTTKYYEVTIRLWLEGEDKTCTVDVFKDLASGQWKLDLELKFEDSTGGVTALKKYTSFESTIDSKMYYFDGTNVYGQAADGSIDTTPVDTSELASGVQAELESAFDTTL